MTCVLSSQSRRNKRQSAIVMEATSLFLLFFVFQGRSCNDKNNTFCTAQQGSVIVEEKSSVTIPCNFTYPKKYSSLEVRVSWRRGWPIFCGGGEIIYKHTTWIQNNRDWTHANYTPRISPVENPKEKGTRAITIQDLRKTDGPMFCCRIEIYEGNEYKKGWQNRHGTQIQFKDEFFVEQTDVVPAIIGEDITIPCLVHNKAPSVIKEVTWSVGNSDVCVENFERIEIWNEETKSLIIGRWSVVNFPQDLSLRIKEGTLEDNKQYCCKVKTKLRGNNVLSPIHGTQVVFAVDSKDSKVKQPETTSPDQDGSATLRCSFIPQSDTDPLWTAIFWRAGGPRGIYAYHPLPEMVDPSYRDRTELRGSADLHIKGVTYTDNTTYYCFVMIRVCVGNNIINSTLQYGSGTKLDLNGTVLGNSGNMMTWVYVLVAVLAAIIVFAVFIIIILKKKGVIGQKRSGREDVNHLTSDIALRDRSPSNPEPTPRVISSASPMTQEDSGGVLYAHLNVSSLQQKTGKESKGKMPDDDGQVLYAAVKPTPPPQDIYSTVHK